MRKFIFFLAWILDFFLALIGITWVVYPQYLQRFNLSLFTIKLIILNISLLYIIIFILKFLTLFKRKNDYELKTEDGKIAISTETVASLVKKALSQYGDIEIKKIEPIFNRGKLKLKLVVESSTTSNLADKIATLQSLLKKYFKESVGIDVESVEIKITKLVENES